jgi:predicted Zn-dependent protease
MNDYTYQCELDEGTIEAWETSVKAGTYWDTDPADTGDVPRLTDKKENRTSRLKAIGNGQVPAQILLAWEVLG